MRILVLLLMLPFALSGCSDGGDEETAPTDEPDAASAQSSPVWTNQTLEGTFAGFNTPLVSGNPGVLAGEGYGSHTLAVPAGAQVLEVSLHLVLPAAEAMLRLSPPGCSSPTCAVDVTTSGGMATSTVELPADGEWHSVLFQEGTPVGATPYHLYVGILA